MAAKWQDDEPFVAALKKRQYVNDKLDGPLSMGLYLYLWELWQDGIEHAIKTADEILGPSSARDVEEAAVAAAKGLNG